MDKVYSQDGTKIAFDRSGNGPVVVLVCGGSVDHTANAPLAALLAAHFSVYNYHRRGRGESGDTPPYAVAREVEDIEAVISAAGGSAYLYGSSSGGALALEAARQIPATISKLALWEPPFIPESYPRPPADTAKTYTELVAAGRRGDAVEFFMTGWSECHRSSPPSHAPSRGGRRKRPWRTHSPTTPRSWATIRCRPSAWPPSRRPRS